MALHCPIASFLLVFSLVSRSSAFLSLNFIPRGISARHSAVCYSSREKWVDERDEEVSYRTKYMGDSDEARELQNMRYEEEVSDFDIVKEDYYYEDDDDEYMEEEKEEDDEAVGNFWSNPKPGFDPLPSERRQTSIMRKQETDSMSEIESSSERRPRPRPRGAPKRKYVAVLDLTS
jgi:hypothetical protein